MRPIRAVPAMLWAIATPVLMPAFADEPKPPLVGGDVDAHGCRPSAGYLWCERTKQCERPWELAQSESFDNSAEAFKAFCGNE
jgi:hypothetical protein